MKDISILILYSGVLFLHWVGDFLLQSHKIASTKSKNICSLLIHVLIYTLWMSVLFFPFFLLQEKLKPYHLMILYVFASHLVTDFITSKISAALWKKEEWHNFFCIIGFDQLIHQLSLMVLVWWLLK